MPETKNNKKIKNADDNKEQPKEDLPGLDLSKYVASGPLATDIQIKKKINKIPVRKPNSQTFFRTHPKTAYHYSVYLLKDEEDGKLYLVKPEITGDLVEQVKQYILYLCVNKSNDPFIFPVPQPNEEGKWNEWHRSQSKCVQKAMEKWIRMQANFNIQGYDIFEAEGNLAEPEFPDMSLEKIFSIAFDDAIINDLDHPIVKKLRGIE